MFSLPKTFIFFICVSMVLPAIIAAQETPLLTFHHPSPASAQDPTILTVKISPDGTKLLAAGYGVKLWDLNTGQELLFILGFGNYVQSAAFSWDGKYIVTGDWLRNIKVFDSQSGKLLQTFQDPETNDPTGDFVFGVAFSPDGKWVLSSQRQKTDLWDVATGQMIRRITTIENVGSYDFFFLPDGVRAVMRSVGAVTVLDVNTGQVLHEFLSRGTAITPDLQRVITLVDGLKIWSLNTGENLYSSNIRLDNVLPDSFFSVYPDIQGFKIAYATEAGNIQVDQLSINASLSKSAIKSFAKEGDKNFTRALFSHDGKKLILKSVDTVYVYDSSVLTSAAPGAEGYK